jgi:hypothetical protein
VFDAFVLQGAIILVAFEFIVLLFISFSLLNVL